MSFEREGEEKQGKGMKCCPSLAVPFSQSSPVYSNFMKLALEMVRASIAPFLDQKGGSLIWFNGLEPEGLWCVCERELVLYFSSA